VVVVQVSSPIERLFDRLGAEVVIKLRTYRPKPLKYLVKERVAVEDGYYDMGADACLPEWSYRREHQASQLVVMWDRPVPYAAGHRKYMMRSILGAGVWEDQVTHLWAYPHDQDSPPLPSQLLEYRAMTFRALEAADTKYVLLVGSAAMSLWRQGLKMKDIQGHSGVMQGRWVVAPIANPVTVLREPMLQAEWRLALYGFMDLVANQEDFNLRAGCIESKCTEGAMMYDPDGIGWCKRHWKKGTLQRENAVSRTNKAVNKLQEPQLEI